MHAVEIRAQSNIVRWSTAAAIFACACNLLSFVLENYQFYYLEQIPLPLVTSYSQAFELILNECISLAPLLVVVIFRDLASVMFIYGVTLFLSLAGRVHYLIEYYRNGVSALNYKIDLPGLLLFVLGTFSLAVVLMWALIRSAIFIGRAVKGSRSAS